jgi:hypothetical protein
MCTLIKVKVLWEIRRDFEELEALFRLVSILDAPDVCTCISCMG